MLISIKLTNGFGAKLSKSFEVAAMADLAEPMGSDFPIESFDVSVPPHGLPGTLRIPPHAFGLVIFAHGSGSSRLSPRNILVADALNRRGMATLLFDLLKPEEEDADNRAKVFEIPLLADRLTDAIRWAEDEQLVRGLPLGLFGASTGAAAALVAAARLQHIRAVVSRGGRPDLAGQALLAVRAPTLLIVGGADHGVIELNEEACARLGGPKELVIVPGATHLFPERGALEQVIAHAERWFGRHLHEAVQQRHR
ncbi:MAG: dienelactone hydrolase family protein [Rhizomicrobium sp.]